MQLAEGYMDVAEFLAFLAGSTSNPFSNAGVIATLALSLLGGMAMNLTPCVLPMVPVNLILIGRSWRRGLAYGAGIAITYGFLGLAAAFGGIAFGSVQSSPYFNLASALVFAALGVALFLGRLDFSAARGTHGPVTGFVGALVMGAMSAVLAGACVAPVLVAVLALTVDLVGRGIFAAAALPFVFGLGMALPWPFAGAGLKVLPKPGAWMPWVNRVGAFALVLLAGWYAFTAISGFRGKTAAVATRGEDGWVEATPVSFPEVLAAAKRPVFVDVRADWCKNCKAMEKKTFRDPKVMDALSAYTLIRLDAEDLDELKRIPEFEKVTGLPAYAIIK